MAAATTPLPPSPDPPSPSPDPVFEAFEGEEFDEEFDAGEEYEMEMEANMFLTSAEADLDRIDDNEMMSGLSAAKVGYFFILSPVVSPGLPLLLKSLIQTHNGRMKTDP